MFEDLYIRLRSLFRRSAAEAELDDELRFHIERQAEKYAAAGMNGDAAQRRARLAFGGVDQIKEDCRDARGLSWIETFLQDVRYAARMFRRTPVFTAVAVFTLALGIGANTAIFAVVEAVLLKPLPYPHPEQLVGLELSPLALDPTVRGIAPEDYFVFREQSRTFQDVGIYLETDADRDVNVTGFAEPERVHALHVTDGVLSLLGVPALLGRTFSRADDLPSAAPTAVLTYSYWQRRFGGDPAIVGRTLVADGVAREIIGVLPRDFRFLDDRDFGLILPLQLDRNRIQLGDFRYFGVARLKPGVSVAQASADVDRMFPIALNSFPAGSALSVDELRKARLTSSLLPLKEEVVGHFATLLWLLMGGVGMVLLIACANVANLLLVRTAARRQELALRAALGAGRRRLAAQLLRESALLGLLGGVCGLGVTWAALRVLVRFAPSGLPRLADVTIDVPAQLFALGVALITSVIFGLIPVFKQAGAPAGIPAAVRTATAGRERHRVQGVLVSLQVALALVLLICSGLMIRTFQSLSHVNPGFAPENVQAFRISIPTTDVPDDASVFRVQQQIRDKLADIPGVSSVAFANSAPMDGDNASLDNVFAADHPSQQGELPPLRRIVSVSPGYLQTLRVPLVAGRDFDWAELYNHVPVALISEDLAREYWGTPTAALGKRVRPSVSREWREVVGVVGDVHDEDVEKPARAAVYWPALMANYHDGRTRVNRYSTFLVRSPLAGSEDFLRQIRAAVWSIDAKAPLARVHTLSYYYTRSMARASFAMFMLGIAAAMALLLGTVGLYGVIAYSVSQRTREIGVRMALGAATGDVISMVMREVLAMVVAGTAIGLAGALAASRFASKELFGVGPNDPATMAAAVVALVLVAAVAGFIPARRATRINPVRALRYE